MQLEPAFISAGIASIVAVFTAIYAKRGGQRLERSRVREAANLRALEALHKEKIHLYRGAFAITERLSQRHILEKRRRVLEAEFVAIREELIEWNLACGPIMKPMTLRAFRSLLESLSRPAKEDGTMSRKARNAAWRNKNWFRGCLKAELSEVAELAA
jgi:hypothetical protein